MLSLLFAVSFKFFRTSKKAVINGLLIVFVFELR